LVVVVQALAHMAFVVLMGQLVHLIPFLHQAEVVVVSTQTLQVLVRLVVQAAAEVVETLVFLLAVLETLAVIHQ
jgi:hypothetical protein